MLGSYYMMSEGQSALALDSSPMPYVFSFIQPRFPSSPPSGWGPIEGKHRCTSQVATKYWCN